MTNLSDAIRLIGVAQLRGLRLVESHTQTAIPPGVVIGDVSANINFGASVPSLPENGTFYVRAGIDVAISPLGSSEAAVSFHATYELQYSCPAELSISQAELSAFAATNAVFHAWPYWREFVQSTFQRMNLPPVVLPVFRVEDHNKSLIGTTDAQAPADSVPQEGR